MSSKTPQLLVTAFVCLLSILPSFAHNNVVVIPMAGDDLKPLQNVISVAKQNGDFSSLEDAVASVSDASSANRYLIVIAPGSYTESGQINIPSYVHVAGSGQNVTRLDVSGGSATLDETAAAITLNHESELSDLSIRFSANNANAIGVYTKRTTSSSTPLGPQLNRVRITGGTPGTLTTVALFDDGGDAILNEINIREAITTATGRELHGLRINNSSTRVSGCDIEVRSTSGGSLTGVFVEALGFGDQPELLDCKLRTRQTVSGTGGSNTGIQNLDIDHIIVRGSSVSSGVTTGTAVSVSGAAVLLNSSLSGPLGTGNQRCVGVDNFGSETSLEELSINCD